MLTTSITDNLLTSHKPRLQEVVNKKRQMMFVCDEKPKYILSLRFVGKGTKMTINTHMSEEKMRGTAMNIIFSFALQSLLHPFLRPTLYSSPYNEVLI